MVSFMVNDSNSKLASNYLIIISFILLSLDFYLLSDKIIIRLFFKLI